MAEHNTLGKWGENIAVEFLIKQGYAIRCTNWRMGHYEVDIIAMHSNRIVFVEVKTRATDCYDPLEAVDRKKKLNMVRAADAYVRAFDVPNGVQYDIITVTGDPGNYKVEHIPDAFLPPLVTRR